MSWDPGHGGVTFTDEEGCRFQATADPGLSSPDWQVWTVQHPTAGELRYVETRQNEVPATGVVNVRLASRWHWAAPALAWAAVATEVVLHLVR